jgi:meso-butanediol dehydrogenase / (S,S)-butanediol dehydrogenase / diacetyl reductase
MWNMAGRVIVVTGGAQGIGRAAARLFAAEGATAVIADVEQDAAAATEREIAVAGGKAWALCCDVSDSASVRAMVDAVIGRFARIDVLFANAAVQITEEAGRTEESDWDRLHAINLKGVFLCCKYVIPVMQAQKSGAIVISSSGHAFATYPKCSVYAATKGGQLAFMRGLALDYAQDGIRVNCVIPGATDTRLVRGFIEASPDPEAARAKLIGSIPMRRLASPEDIARAVLFLASDYASYITGTSLAVDGGLLAQA